MVSSIPPNAFGEGGSGLDGAHMPKLNVRRPENESAAHIRNIQKVVKSNFVGDILKIGCGGGCATVLVMGTIVGGIATLSHFESTEKTSETLMGACQLNSALGTTTSYKTGRPNGTYFPHAILKTASDTTDPFIVFGDYQKPIHVFQDKNSNEILDGQETLHTFDSPKQAREFLTEQVLQINRSTNE